MTIDSLDRPECGVLRRQLSSSARDLDVLTRTVITHLATGPMAQTVQRGEVKAVVRICLEWLIQRLNGHPVPTVTDRLESAAGECARAGIPIDTVLHAVNEGCKLGLDLIARPGPADALGVVTGIARVVELSELVTVEVSKAYVREHKADAAEHQTETHNLTSALLGGHLAGSELSFAAEYFVLAIALPAHPDEGRPGLDRQVVARRKLRRLQSALATELGGQALSLLSVDGGTILVPGTARAEAELDDLVQALAAAACVPVTATVVLARPEGVPAAARQAHELLDTAQRLGRGPGVHRFAELALQHQLSRPGIGRDVLGHHLAPLDEHPDLRETLQLYIDSDLSRQRTAEQLGVHPNTVDYRLRRIGELTGFDPARAGGLWYLRSALVARLGFVPSDGPQ
ncbi:PucR family transcriptional regulator [Nocardia brasiliensis]|uniref:PucR family transcriptional regulator n=1 Tax=Nocardia brasiliensis TaxID=37326 RepID=UPI00189568D9|nr:helix-turn-helix domain-containing protein [Nocardia brasiliensis]MBF6125809.1 helix-turn-helix domain-containing protein [Nocardia brasiliensis]